MIEELPEGYRPPKKATKSRRYTPKIMLSVALSRPEKKDGKGFYGGKIALIRCTKDVVAQRSSKNHKRGSIYKQDASLNSKMFQKQLTRTIFPSIKTDESLLQKSERFAKQLKLTDPFYSLPQGCKWADLSVQTENAPPHCKKSKRLYPMIKKAGGRNVVGGVYFGPKVRLQFQPRDSPDLNILDLGFFANFWTKIHKILKTKDNVPTVDDVWDAAKVAWDNITPVDIEVLFRTLKSRMKQVIECNGRNDMTIPHNDIRETVQAEDNELRNMNVASSLNII